MLCAGLLLAFQAPDAPDDSPPEGTEVLARGPVHEAFGEPTRVNPVPSPVVAQEPPQPIEEMPPEDKPEGDNITWIPGYWAWEPTEEQFLWVSGFWRAVPPGRTWVPGEWHQVSDGYQWSSGYWANLADDKDGDGSPEVEYLPPPPESLDAGPSVPAPDESSFYVPGCWHWSSTRYLWQPGHWVPFRPGWCWTPACYKWCPAGYIFVPGFWDRPLLNRGVMFAPVRFTRPIWRRADFVYRPSYVVEPDSLCGALFVPTYASGYYFGDYFDARYRRRFVPWVDYHPTRSAFDVNYAYYRHAFARNDAWEKNLRTLYARRFAGEIPRPPRTLVQQTKVINQLTVNKTVNRMVDRSINITNIQNVRVVTPIRRLKKVEVTALASLAGPKAAPPKAVAREVRIQKISRERLVQEKQAITWHRTLARQRHEIEAKLIRETPRPEARKTPVKVRVPLPKGTKPPPHIIRSTEKAPPHPVAPKPAPVHPDKVRPIKRPMDKVDVPPPKGKPMPPHKAVPPKKEKDDVPVPKGKPTPPPKKEKDDVPAPKGKPTPPPKKEKDDVPVPKGKPTPPPKKEKDDVPVPKGKPTPPPKVTPPPKPIPPPKVVEPPKPPPKTPPPKPKPPKDKDDKKKDKE